MPAETRRADARKNIVLLMTDQHRLDHVGYHGNGKLPTPHIDRIAESVGFTNCVSVNPVCMPARASLLTGKYSHQIGALSMSGDLSLQHPTYMRALQQAGYHTSGIGKFHWLQGWRWKHPVGGGHDLVRLEDSIKRYGLDFVWEVAGKQLASRNRCHYAAHLEEKGLLEPYREFVRRCGPNAAEAERQQFVENPFPFSDCDYADIMIGDRIVERIERRPPDRPFFIFGSFVGPHPPYDPPQRYLDRVSYAEEDDFIPDGETMLSEEAKRKLYRLRRAYKAMIVLIDEQIGRIMAKLEEEKLLDDTVILFTSDHGEMMGDHGRVQKMSPYRQSVVVPTAIRHPDYLHGAVNRSPVEIIDLTATMLDIAGLDPQAALSLDWPAFHNRVPARSLMPIVAGERDAIREFGFSECGGEWAMIQSEKWKYVRYFAGAGRPEPYEAFYDSATDPEERINRANDPGMAKEISRHREWRQELMDRTPPAQLRWAPLLIE